ncbi:MAG: prepilin-type N-terminal cleavage/methylation domain-containing protein [Thermoanaerobaculia bacterium]|nr:prepilin-type N-terminal cleavage/methylation domain-containing protein [Thermoanaerobaculia bacterium]
MWPSTSSRASAGSRGRRVRGFTLLEAMVSLLLLVIILTVAMTMLFQMRAFAERQQYFMLPRQAARRATDYLSYYIAGASDVNYVNSLQQSPNALITYYNLGGVLTQSSYNNLGCPDAVGATTCTEPGNGPRVIPANPPAIPAAINSTNFGDIGTDIITMVAPFNPSRYQVFAPYLPTAANKDLYVNFRVGCGTDDATNMAAFRAATGDDGTQSALLMLVDRTGRWEYVRIPTLNYVGSDCADIATFKNIHIQVDTTAGTLAPPNGTGGLTDPVFLVAGLQIISFRVLTDSVDGVPKLQQKLGLFDPANDNPYPPIGPLPSFTNVLENVEDLQVAYMYQSGAIWNTGGQTIHNVAPDCPLVVCNKGVPFQAGPGGIAAPPVDIQNVIGVRFSVTGRSPLLPIGARKLTNVDVRHPLATTTSQHFRPASEDHAVTMDTGNPTWPLYDQFDHYRATATLMLRNRIPRG